MRDQGVHHDIATLCGTRDVFINPSKWNVAVTVPLLGHRRREASAREIAHIVLIGYSEPPRTAGRLCGPANVGNLLD